MMAGSAAEEKTFRRFLELFLREMRMPLQDTDPVPTRPVSDLLTEDELEGECLELCLQHLYKYNCPCSLAAALARATADGVLQMDMTPLSRTQEGVDFPQVESEKLARLLFNVLFETCSLWVKELPFQRRPQPYYETSIHAIKNMRRKMEDKHIIIPDFNSLFNIQDQEEQAFFAVFDGHGGVDAANYAATHLHVNLVHQESFNQDLGEALYRAFRLTDEQFVKKASREHLRCGTTGVVTFLRGNTLHVAWLGDSQVILVRRGQVVELMKPHKPDREDEKKRIEALGGCVIWFGTWRVNGSLSVSRAIGDSEHKPYICGDADRSLFPLDGTEDYLILACDGFWDTVGPEEAVRVVSDHLSENTGDTTMVAHKLVASARDAGSSDNITVMVVFLRDPRCQGSLDEEEEPMERAEPAEEGGAGEEEEEEEENEEGSRVERSGEGGSKADQGVKSRGWPLQQCSAPADLAYEDRTDSLTDRTTLSLGPPFQSSIALPRISGRDGPQRRRSLLWSQELGSAAPLSSVSCLFPHAAAQMCPRRGPRSAFRPGHERRRLRRALGPTPHTPHPPGPLYSLYPPAEVCRHRPGDARLQLPQ